MRLVIFLTLLVAMMSWSPVRAQVSAKDPETIVKALQAEGYRASLTKDDVGDPKIDSAMAGWSVGIFFFGCTENKDCTSIKFSSGFDRTLPMSVPKLHKWLDDHRFGKAFLDNEGDPIFEWDVVLGDGIPSSVFASVINTFDDAVGTFGQFVFDEDASGLEKNGIGRDAVKE